MTATPTNSTLAASLRAKSLLPGLSAARATSSPAFLDNGKADTICEFVREAVSNKVSLLCTDQFAGYKRLDAEYPRQAVDHSAGEYVVGAVHTNTIEGFWSIFKRGVLGTFHKVSAKYMQLYVAEFHLRYNCRRRSPAGTCRYRSRSF